MNNSKHMGSNIYTIQGEVILTSEINKAGKNGIYWINRLFVIRPTRNYQTIMAFFSQKETSYYIKSIDVGNIVEVVFYFLLEKTQEGWSYRLIELSHTILKRKK